MVLTEQIIIGDDNQINEALIDKNPLDNEELIASEQVNNKKI